MMNQPRKKKQLSTAEAKKLIPLIKKLNSATKVLIKLFTQKVSHEEQQANKIKVLINDMLIPPNKNTNIKITTLDMNNTKIRKKGEMSYNQIMKWEKAYKQRNRGTML
ncbi:MAG: hypothetical protein VW378_04515 [bacterium]